MQKSSKPALPVTREQNYPDWYLEVIKAGELAENAATRGCMVIKPWGYAIWERIQKILDHEFKETGHQNAYFPLLIPLSFMQKEAEHVSGFAKECAVVTHHRLVQDDSGQLVPDGKLDEPFVIRPTSETVIADCFSKWIQSYRDLPLLINQWANVMRWEMRTRLFLRTAEFLWQEGHTAHATAQEAQEETAKMLEIYRDFCRNVLAMPVLAGEKPVDERFPGAVQTYCIEAMMQDGKALQAGTSHFLGQNFAKASDISFVDKEEKIQFAWTTSWGVSTRLIGGLIMTHSDDDGVVLPPRIAPQQVVLIPYLKEKSRTLVLETCEKIKKALENQQVFGEPLRVELDLRDQKPSTKKWQAIKKGYPVRLEIGEKDIESQSFQAHVRACPELNSKATSMDELLAMIPHILEEQQLQLFQQAERFRDERTAEAHSLEELTEFFQKGSGFLKVNLANKSGIAEQLKAWKVSPRLILDEEGGKCILGSKEPGVKMIVARAY